MFPPRKKAPQIGDFVVGRPFLGPCKRYRGVCIRVSDEKIIVYGTESAKFCDPATVFVIPDDWLDTHNLLHTQRIRAQLHDGMLVQAEGEDHE
jgi:hypothetical protein